MKSKEAFVIGCLIAIGVVRALQYKREAEEREMTREAMQRTAEIMKDWQPKVTFTTE
jgi:hypothetical protein